MTLSLTSQGFDYVAYYNGAYENANSLDSLDETGADATEASLDYGIDPQTNTVYADSSYTDSLNALGATISQAVGLGLSVMVRPLIDFVKPSDLTGTPYSVDDWRTYYNPGAAGSAGANAFFASYETMILQEAQVAAANGATSLCIGTELDQITGPAYKSYWDGIISALRADYPTLKLTYAADWDDDLSPWQWGGTGLAAGTGNLATQVSFASELDSIGIDCYAPISDAANPTLAQLVAGWTQTPTDATSLAVTGGQSLVAYFESVAAAVGKPLIFTELGYANASDAASQPAYSSTNVVDSGLQAELYQAFFEAWQASGNSSLTGVYFWNWDPNAAEVGPGEGVNFSPQGLPALGVIDDWFGPGLTTAFNAPAIGANGEIALSGTAMGAVGPQTVEMFNGSSDLGAATVNSSTGAWCFTAVLPAGSYRFTALATDEDGKQTSGLAPFGLTIGVTGEPYSIILIDYNSSGGVAARSDYASTGGLYLGEQISTENGDTLYDYGGGSYFTGLPYNELIYTYNSSGVLLEKQFYENGALYLGEQISTQSGDAIDDYKGGSDFNGLPYNELIYTLDSSGVLLEKQSYENGALYLGDQISTQSGDTIDDYKGGSDFNGLPYNELIYTFNSSGVLLEKQSYENGALYLGDQISTQSGDTIDDYKGGSDFNGLPYNELIYTFNSSGVLLEKQSYENGALYLGEQISTQNGDTIDDYKGGSYFNGLPYDEQTTTLNSSGGAIAVARYEDGVLYLSYQTSTQGGDTIDDCKGGSDFNGLPYNELVYAYNSSGALLSRTYDMNDGAHALDGSADGLILDSIENDTMTGGGSNETFFFNPGFGADIVTDFAQHLSSPGADTISVSTSQFANFTALLAATQNVGTAAVITAQNGDSITLDNMTKQLVAANEADFAFHA